MDFKADAFAALLGIEFSRRTDTGLVTTTRVEQKHLNPYRIAHGGIAYTLGCVTAQWSAAVCLNREMEVCAVSSQYLSSLALETAECESHLLFDGGDRCTYEVQVRNETGRICFSQQVTLRPRAVEAPGNMEFPRTIFPAGADVAPDPETGLRFPLLSPGPFCDVTQIYVLESSLDVTVMGADILPDTCDDCGAAHCGLVYTCCDTGVGAGSGLRGKMAVTVSSMMEYFRPATVGPVRAEARCIREGHTILYYQVTATDGEGVPIAAGQFCMHPKRELKELIR